MYSGREPSEEAARGLAERLTQFFTNPITGQNHVKYDVAYRLPEDIATSRNVVEYI